MAKYASKSPPATEQEYYCALGKALSAWAHIDQALGHTFLRLIKGGDSVQIGKIFFSVINFRDRLSMVDAAAQYSLSGKPGLRIWNKLRQRAMNCASRRSQIAHAVAWTRPESGTYGSRPLPYLMDLPIEWKKRRQRILTPKALKDAEQLFQALTNDLIAFYLKLPSSRAP